MFGILRKVDKLGPWSCYLRLLGLWKDKDGMGPRKIAEKVMRFFRHYAVNRHKATIITPSIHLSAYSESEPGLGVRGPANAHKMKKDPDDNRADLRPFLYVVNWPFQFGKIRAHADELERKMGAAEQTAMSHVEPQI